MQVLAHRGYHVDVPENTLDAFDRAVDLGVDGIETDVRMSADGEAILFHDRLAPDGRAVADLTRRALSDLVGYPVPTLDAALGRHPGIVWNLEIKAPAARDATAAAVLRFAPTTRFLVTSFWHPVVEQVSAIVPVDCGLLIAHCPLSVASLVERPISGHVNTLVWYFETVDAPRIEEASRLGLRNLVYGAVTRSEHDRLLGLGVDGVITDHLDYLIGGPATGDPGKERDRSACRIGRVPRTSVAIGRPLSLLWRAGLIAQTGILQRLTTRFSSRHGACITPVRDVDAPAPAVDQGARSHLNSRDVPGVQAQLEPLGERAR